MAIFNSYVSLPEGIIYIYNSYVTPLVYSMSFQALSVSACGVLTPAAALHGSSFVERVQVRCKVRRRTGVDIKGTGVDSGSSL